MGTHDSKSRTPPPPERRDFARRDASLSGTLSLTPDFKQTWPVTVRNISLTGMHLVGDLPDIGDPTVYLRLDGTQSSIPCDRVSQNANGLRVKIELDNLEIDRLLQESDVYAALVLESIPDIFSAR